MKRRAWLLSAAACSMLVGAGAAGCSGKTHDAKSAQSATTRSGSRCGSLASELLPAGLDLVVRVDWEKIRRGSAGMGAANALAARLDPGSRVAPSFLLERARVIYWGTRWMPDGVHGDGVLAADGDFGSATDFDPTVSDEDRAKKAPWKALGSAKEECVRSFYRERPESRSEPVLLLVSARGAVALATSLEEDALWRVAAHGPDASRIEPPALGLLSFAARVRGMPTLLDGPGRALLDRVSVGLSRASGSAELGQGAFDFELSLTYADSEGAEAAAGVVREALDATRKLGASVAAVAESARIVPLGGILRIELSIPFQLVGPALGVPALDVSPSIPGSAP